MPASLRRSRGQPSTFGSPRRPQLKLPHSGDATHDASCVAHQRLGLSSEQPNMMPREAHDDIRGVLDPHRFHEPVSPYVLRPDAWWRVVWNILLGVAALVSAIQVPLDVAYSKGDRTFDGMAMNLLFACDLVLAFFTAYHDAALQPITNLRLIRRRALLIDFFPGLCSSLPFALLDGAFHSGRNPLVLLKLFRLVKLSVAKRSLADAGVHPGVLRLIQMSLVYLLTVHCNSCLYWAVATREAGATLDDLGCDPAVSPLVESWGVCPELREESARLFDQYFHSFYIAAVIMKGSNYPAPLETPSKIFTGVVLLIGAVLQAGVIAAAASLLANLDKHRLALRQRLDEVDAHLSHHKVDASLKKKVRSFFHYLFHCGHLTKEDELLSGLSEKLRMQILLARMSTLVEKGLIFRHISSACTLALVQKLEPIIVLPKEYVIVQGRHGHEMFFVARGLVQVTVVHDLVEYPIELLGEGAAFGSSALLDKRGHTRRATSVLTVRFCELLQLGRKDFNWLVATFSEFHECTKKLRDKRLKALTDCVKQLDEERDHAIQAGVHTRAVPADAPPTSASMKDPPAAADGQSEDCGSDGSLVWTANEKTYGGSFAGGARVRKVHPTPLQVESPARDAEHLAERMGRCRAPSKLRPPSLHPPPSGDASAVARWWGSSSRMSRSNPEQVGNEHPSLCSDSPASTEASSIGAQPVAASPPFAGPTPPRMCSGSELETSAGTMTDPSGAPRLMRQGTENDDETTSSHTNSPGSFRSSPSSFRSTAGAPHNASFRKRRKSSNGLNALRSVLDMSKANDHGEHDLIRALSESIDSPMSPGVDYAPFRRSDSTHGSGSSTPALRRHSNEFPVADPSERAVHDGGHAHGECGQKRQVAPPAARRLEVAAGEGGVLPAVAHEDEHTHRRAPPLKGLSPVLDEEHSASLAPDSAVFCRWGG